MPYRNCQAVATFFFFFFFPPPGSCCCCQISAAAAISGCCCQPPILLLLPACFSSPIYLLLVKPSLHVSRSVLLLHCCCISFAINIQQFNNLSRLLTNFLLSFQGFIHQIGRHHRRHHFTHNNNNNNNNCQVRLIWLFITTNLWSSFGPSYFQLLSINLLRQQQQQLEEEEGQFEQQFNNKPDWPLPFQLLNLPYWSGRSTLTTNCRSTLTQQLASNFGNWLAPIYYLWVQAGSQTFGQPINSTTISSQILLLMLLAVISCCFAAAILLLAPTTSCQLFTGINHYTTINSTSTSTSTTIVISHPLDTNQALHQGRPLCWHSSSSFTLTTTTHHQAPITLHSLPLITTSPGCCRLQLLAAAARQLLLNI